MPRRTAVLAFAILWSLATTTVSTQTPDVRGAWRADAYHLKDGHTYPVSGLIVFTSRDWLVLFFVTPDGGTPRRGSGEGGSYTLKDDALVFTHLYNLSAGDALPGLPESPLRMEVRDAAKAPIEPSRVEVTGDRMTLSFPSGNRMTFQRSSGFE